eukprot:GHVH01006600.1.p1 GENE.GHVH01006600.1~~GHVH01006600.1.p1  ORF type:complete len:266 (+),score=31.87 GHVH01006600.1:1341-2138(+)
MTKAVTAPAMDDEASGGQSPSSSSVARRTAALVPDRSGQNSPPPQCSSATIATHPDANDSDSIPGNSSEDTFLYPPPNGSANHHRLISNECKPKYKKYCCEASTISCCAINQQNQNQQQQQQISNSVVLSVIHGRPATMITSGCFDAGPMPADEYLGGDGDGETSCARGRGDSVEQSYFATLSASYEADTDKDVTARRKLKCHSRCGICKEKMGLLGIKCRCGVVYCSKHRFPLAHKCGYDFKSEGRSMLTKKVKLCVASKVPRF